MKIEKKVFVVTYIEDYCLEGQWVYAAAEEAREKLEEVEKSLFEGLFNEHIDDFEEGDTFADYQDSVYWWDDDCRSKVYINEVINGGAGWTY